MNCKLCGLFIYAFLINTAFALYKLDTLFFYYQFKDLIKNSCFNWAVTSCSFFVLNCIISVYSFGEVICRSAFCVFQEEEMGIKHGILSEFMLVSWIGLNIWNFILINNKDNYCKDNEVISDKLRWCLLLELINVFFLLFVYISLCIYKFCIKRYLKNKKKRRENNIPIANVVNEVNEGKVIGIEMINKKG